MRADGAGSRQETASLAAPGLPVASDLTRGRSNPRRPAGKASGSEGAACGPCQACPGSARFSPQVQAARQGRGMPPGRHLRGRENTDRTTWLRARTARYVWPLRRRRVIGGFGSRTCVPAEPKVVKETSPGRTSCPGTRVGGAQPFPRTPCVVSSVPVNRPSPPEERTGVERGAPLRERRRATSPTHRRQKDSYGMQRYPTEGAVGVMPTHHEQLTVPAQVHLARQGALSPWAESRVASDAARTAQPPAGAAQETSRSRAARRPTGLPGPGRAVRNRCAHVDRCVTARRVVQATALRAQSRCSWEPGACASRPPSPEPGGRGPCPCRGR